MDTKICSKCEILKNLNDFYTRHAICKNCYALKVKKYRQENKEKKKEYNKRYYEKNNKNKLYKKNKEYREMNPNKLKEYNKTQSKKDISNLSNRYIKNQLIKKGFSSEDFKSNPMIIELQRAIIINKRSTKNNQNE